MSGSSPQARPDTVLLLLGGGGLVLLVVYLSLGPASVAAHPSLIWALLLLPVLVITAAARLLVPSIILAVGILGLGLLALIAPATPNLRWWMAGGLATLLAATGTLTLLRKTGAFGATADDGSEAEAGMSTDEDLIAGKAKEMADGIFHRPLVDVFLHKQLAVARRGEDLTVVLMNLDDFDDFRQTHGQDAAEQLLSKVENSLHTTVRDSDVVGRYGEQEFLTLLLGEDSRGGHMFANRVKKKISRLAVEARDGTVIDSGVTVSVGIASFHEGIASPSELVDEAQRILDDAMAQGGDRILVARRRPAE